MRTTPLPLTLWLLLAAPALTHADLLREGSSSRTCRFSLPDIPGLLGNVCGLGSTGGDNPLLYQNPNTVCNIDGQLRMNGLPDFSVNNWDFNTCSFLQDQSDQMLGEATVDVNNSPPPQGLTPAEIEQIRLNMTRGDGSGYPPSGGGSGGAGGAQGGGSDETPPIIPSPLPEAGQHQRNPFQQGTEQTSPFKSGDDGPAVQPIPQ